VRADAPPNLFDAWGPEPRDVAEQNKLLDFYLETLAGTDAVNLELKASRHRRNDIQNTIVTLAVAAKAIDVDWAIFKTVRPFAFVPSDIDVLVLTDNGAGRLASALAGSKYRPAGAAPHTITVCDTETDIGIDFYQDVAASRFVYLESASFRRFRTTQEIDHVAVPALSPVAEILCILAHAVYKEQMFTLADYLTLRRFADDFASSGWDELLSLARVNGVQNAVLWCLRVAAGTTQVLRDSVRWPASAGAAPLTPKKLPYRLLDPRMLARALAERVAASSAARRSIALLAVQSMNPVSPYTRALYRELWKRAKGETY
jgi:hypothetical protein